jgi:hypothetical protein
VGAKFGVGVDLFFVSYVRKYRTFSHITQHNTTQHNNQPSIDHWNHVRWPPNHRTMATRAIQHHCRYLPLPLLPSRPSILPWGRWPMKQPPRQHEDGAMAGSSCSSAQDVLGRGDQCNNCPPILTDRFNDQSIGRRSIGGCNNQLEGEGKTQQTDWFGNKVVVFCDDAAAGLQHQTQQSTT